MASVLLADDSRFMRSWLRRIVEKCGHRVVAEAANGIQALTLYERVRPDVVFMDLTMPEMSGLEAIRHIVSMDFRARVVVCSAMGQPSFVIDALKAGARGFIVKPFRDERVLEELDCVLTKNTS